MGYILLINLYQYMHYSNRIQFREENLKDFTPVKDTIPVFTTMMKVHLSIVEVKRSFHS